VKKHVTYFSYYSLLVLKVTVYFGYLISFTDKVHRQIYINTRT